MHSCRLLELDAESAKLCAHLACVLRPQPIDTDAGGERVACVEFIERVVGDRTQSAEIAFTDIAEAVIYKLSQLGDFLIERHGQSPLLTERRYPVRAKE